MSGDLGVRLSQAFPSTRLFGPDQGRCIAVTWTSHRRNHTITVTTISLSCNMVSCLLPAFAKINSAQGGVPRYPYPKTVWSPSGIYLSYPNSRNSSSQVAGGSNHPTGGQTPQSQSSPYSESPMQPGNYLPAKRCVPFSHLLSFYPIPSISLHIHFVASPPNFIPFATIRFTRNGASFIKAYSLSHRPLPFTTPRRTAPSHLAPRFFLLLPPLLSFLFFGPRSRSRSNSNPRRQWRYVEPNRPIPSMMVTFSIPPLSIYHSLLLFHLSQWSKQYKDRRAADSAE
jgi:hypothetical protein